MHVIYLPRLGQTMESGVITRWHLDEGDQFTAGDSLYEVETEKTNTDVDARQSGRLARISVSAGQEVPVGAALAVAAETGEELSEDQIAAAIGTTAGVRQDSVSVASSSAAKDESEPIRSTPASGQMEPEPAPPGPGDSPTKAYPRARRLAQDLGLDLETITGTGQNRAVTTKDVREATALTKQQLTRDSVAPRTSHADRSASEDERDDIDAPAIAARIPLRGVRRAMADAVTRSWQHVPQFVQGVTADATALVARYRRLRYEGIQATYTDLLIGAVAATVAERAEVNARFTESEILQFADVNVSVAVATARGLVVPVVHSADRLSPAEIGACTRDLADRAERGALRDSDMRYGTITVSNLGAYGIDRGTPLVNEPQAAIVFAGSIAERPTVRQGQLTAGMTVQLCIAYDHRVVDGASAARFTTALQDKVQAGG